MDWSNTQGMAAAVLILALLTVIMLGCSSFGMTAKQAAITTSHVIALERAFDQVEPIVEDNIGAVEKQDREKVRRAWETLKTIRNQIRDDNPAQVLSNVERSEDLYERARAAYTTLRPIAQVMIENGTIPQGEAAMLARIDQRAQALDEQAQSLGANERAMAALQFARDMIPLVRSIILAVV